MIKISISLFLCVTTSLNAVAQRSGKHSYIQHLSSKDTLHLYYVGGDDTYQNYEILIFKNGKSVFAAQYDNPAFAGTQQRNPWLKRLSRKNIRRIEQYISDFTNRSPCIGAGSVYEYIFMAVNKDTFADYVGSCDLGFPIETKLFQNEYKALADREKQFTDSLSTVISGIWYPGAVRHDSLWKYLFLDRHYQSDQSYSKDCTWIFSPPDNFRSHCQVLDLTNAAHYRWSVSRAQVGIDILAGYSTEPNDPNWQKSEEREYTVVKISPHQIVLKNRWGY